MYEVKIGTVVMTADEADGVEEIVTMKVVHTAPDMHAAEAWAEDAAIALQLSESSGTGWWWQASSKYHAVRAIWIEEI